MRDVAGFNPPRFRVDPLTAVEYREITEGRAWIAVHGMVNYRDTYNVPRWTKFCLAWVPKAGFFNGQSYTAYNDVDKSHYPN
jgi:hypothetical protein